MCFEKKTNLSQKNWRKIIHTLLSAAFPCTLSKMKNISTNQITGILSIKKTTRMSFVLHRSCIWRPNIQYSIVQIIINNFASVHMEDKFLNQNMNSSLFLEHVDQIFVRRWWWWWLSIEYLHVSAMYSWLRHFCNVLEYICVGNWVWAECNITMLFVLNIEGFNRQPLNHEQIKYIEVKFCCGKRLLQFP